MKVTGVIQAGGLSTRMGRPKALIELGGRPIIARVLAAQQAARNAPAASRAIPAPLIPAPMTITSCMR